MASTEPPETRHRLAVRVLVVLATILAFLAIFTSWVDRQALDTNEWVDTSGKLLQDKEISDALAVYSVDQLYASVDVARILKKRLPPDLQPVSSPLAAGIRQFATQAAKQAFQSPRVQKLWGDANRAAHTQLVAILEDKNEAIVTQNGKVFLDLQPIVLQLANRIGLKKQAQDAIQRGESQGILKPSFARLEIADSKQLDTARTITKLIEGLAWLFTVGTLALFALAAYLAGRGRRWVVVLGYGLGLVAAGLAAIAVRAALKTPFVDSLGVTTDARVPAEHAWNIGTSLLQSIATDVVIFGIGFVIASYLSSPAPSAMSIRRAAAPTLRDRPGVVWSVFAALALLAVIIWPPSGTRLLVFTLLLIVLAGVWLEEVRRLTARECPGAKKGDWMKSMRKRMSDAGSEAGRRVGSAVRQLSTDEEKHPDDAKLERLEKLGELKEKGVLTAAEFREEKKKVLSG
jgi:Short C-terminal domain